MKQAHTPVSKNTDLSAYRFNRRGFQWTLVMYQGEPPEDAMLDLHRDMNRYGMMWDNLDSRLNDR